MNTTDEDAVHYYCVLKQNTLFFFKNPKKISDHQLNHDVQGAEVRPATTKMEGKYGIEIEKQEQTFQIV